MRILVARVILGIAAATFLFFGVAYLVAPASMTAVVGLHPTNPTATADIRAVYGGLEVAIAFLLAVCVARRARTRDGLVAAAVMFAGLGIARIGSALLADGAIEPVTLRITAGELFGAAGCAFGLWIARRS